MNDEENIIIVFLCSFFAVILFAIGIITLPMGIGIFLLIAGYYCHKKTKISWWGYVVAFLLSLFN